jgi:competence protein ComEA
LNWKKSIPSFLAFTRKDRIGILLLLTIILLFLFSGSILPSARPTADFFADSAWIAALRKLEIGEAVQKEFAYKQHDDDALAIHPYEKTVSRYNPGRPRQLFPFDPNTIDAEGWK